VELIKKINILQRKLITKQEQFVSKDMIVQKRQKEINDLEALTQRRLNPEFAEEFVKLKFESRKKTEVLKGLTAEKNMYISEISEFKRVIELMTSKLRVEKRKHLCLSKKFQRLKEEQIIEMQKKAWV
jgi:hypothetical protein